MRWWRITFHRAGQWADAYNVEALTADQALTIAEEHHCNGGLWAGDVYIEEIAPPKIREDMSVTMEELSNWAKRKNAEHEDVPF